MKAKDSFQMFRQLVEGPEGSGAYKNRVDKKLNRKSIKLFLKENITQMEYDYILRFLSVLPEIEDIFELDSMEEFKKDLHYRMYRRPIYNVK